MPSCVTSRYKRVGDEIGTEAPVIIVVLKCGRTVRSLSLVRPTIGRGSKEHCLCKVDIDLRVNFLLQEHKMWSICLVKYRMAARQQRCPQVRLPKPATVDIENIGDYTADGVVFVDALIDALLSMLCFTLEFEESV